MAELAKFMVEDLLRQVEKLRAENEELRRRLEDLESGGSQSLE
jgi:hypothetical protein